MGSLTGPPCSEGVTWFVLKTPMETSAEEINAFAELYPHDVRPLQPLNGRVVKESQQGGNPRVTTHPHLTSDSLRQLISVLKREGRSDSAFRAVRCW
jgi:hypothetical protein